MRGTRSLAMAAVVAVLTLVGVSPAAAQTPFHGSLHGVISGFIEDSGAVEARCGEGWDWITQTEGSGQISGIGDVTFTTEHCAHVVTLTAKGAVIRLGLGVLTLSGGGGVLDVAYEQMVLFKGDLATGAGTGLAPGRYVVVDGSGDFEGASGNGSMFTTIDTDVVHHELHGSLSADG